MSRVLITGSTDGLGLMAAQLLVDQGHDVTLHARNDVRSADARAALPQAEVVGVGDLSSISGMPDDLSLAPVTQAWLAVSDDPAATVSGGYFFHQRPRDTHPAARSTAVQDGLIQRCAELTDVRLPPGP
jgi:NAD(P)-dependent dehydrogenase (short-subunit alcohol dehydrogenase family)